MLQLPIGTEVKRQLPKKSIYSKFQWNTIVREKFDADVAKIVITHELTSATLSISEGETITSIFVLHILLKHKDYDERNILQLTKVIKQSMLFLLEYNEKAQLAVFHNRLFKTSWQDINELVIPLQGINMDDIWQNIVLQIGKIQLEDSNTLDEQIKMNEEQRKLEKQLKALKRKAYAEKQPKRKLELVQEIKRLQQEIR